MWKKITLVLLAIHCSQQACLPQTFLEALNLTFVTPTKTGVAADFAIFGLFYEANNGVCVNDAELSTYWGTFKKTFTSAQMETISVTNKAIKGMEQTLKTLKGRVKKVSGNIGKQFDKLDKTEKDLEKKSEKLLNSKPTLLEAIYLNFKELVAKFDAMDLTKLEFKNSKQKEFDEFKDKNNFDPRYKPKDTLEKEEDREASDLTEKQIIDKLKEKDIKTHEELDYMKEIVFEEEENLHNRKMALGMLLKEMTMDNQRINKELKAVNGYREGEFVICPKDWDPKKKDFTKEELKDHKGNDIDIEGFGKKHPPKQAPQRGGSRLLEASKIPEGFIKKAISEVFHDIKPLKEKLKETQKLFEEMGPIIRDMEEKELKLRDDEINAKIGGTTDGPTAEEIIAEVVAFSKLPIVSDYADVFTDPITAITGKIVIAFEIFVKMMSAFDQLKAMSIMYDQSSEAFTDMAYGDSSDGTYGKGDKEGPENWKPQEWKDNIDKSKFKDPESPKSPPPQRRMLVAESSEGSLIDFDTLEKEFIAQLTEMEAAFKKYRTELETAFDEIVKDVETVVANMGIEAKKTVNQDKRKVYIQECIDLNKAVILKIDTAIGGLNAQKLTPGLTDEQKAAIDQQIKGLEFVKKEAQKPLKVLEEWKVKAEDNSDVAIWLEVLKRTALKQFMYYRLQYNQLDIEMARIKLEQGLQNHSSEEMDKIEIKIEALEVFLGENEELVNTFRDKETRTKCFESQFELMGGVLAVATSANASNFFEFDANGNVTNLNIDQASTDKVIENCVGILFSTCTVLEGVSLINQINNTSITSQFSEQIQTCNYIDEIYNCLIDFSSCSTELKTALVETLFNPFENAVSNTETPDDILDKALKNFDKFDGTLEGDHFNEQDLAKGEEFMKKFDEAEFLGVDLDKNQLFMDESQEPPKRVLEASATPKVSDVSYKVSSSLDYSLIKISGDAGLDTKSVEDSISGLPNILDDPIPCTGDGCNSGVKVISIAFIVILSLSFF